MAIEDTKRVYSTSSEEIANKYLALGWKLISLSTNEHSPVHVVTYYKLAWQNEGEPIEPEKTDWSKNPFLGGGEFE